jgi:hypothetical protein
VNFSKLPELLRKPKLNMDKACRPRSTDATLGARIAYLVGISCRDLARFPCVVQRPTGRLALRVIPRRPVRHREAAGAVAQTWAVAPVKPVLVFQRPRQYSTSVCQKTNRATRAASTSVANPI